MTKLLGKASGSLFTVPLFYLLSSAELLENVGRVGRKAVSRLGRVVISIRLRLLNQRLAGLEPNPFQLDTESCP